MLSMMPDTVASSWVMPFPCETDRERPKGRTTVQTGIPMVSSPVMLARRVMPKPASSGFNRPRVSRAATSRMVPPRSLPRLIMRAPDHEKPNAVDEMYRPVGQAGYHLGFGGMAPV